MPNIVPIVAYVVDFISKLIILELRYFILYMNDEKYNKIMANHIGT